MLIAFVLPALLLFLFGYGVSLDTTRTRIGLALQDQSAPALSLALAYRQSPWFEVDTRRSIAPMKDDPVAGRIRRRPEEHTSELQSLMTISYPVFCLIRKK